MDSEQPILSRTSPDLVEQSREAGGSSEALHDRQDPHQLEAEVRAIHEQHAATLFNFARKHSRSAESAEESLQEAYYRYLLARASGRAITDPRAWLLRVIHNLSIDSREALSRTEQLGPGIAAPDTADPAVEPPSLGELLGKTSRILSRREQEVLELRLQGLPYADVAKTLGIGHGSVTTYLSRAFRKLRGIRGRWVL